LHRALSQAEKWGEIARSPAAVVDPPRIPRTEMRPPTLAEARALLEAAQLADDRLVPLLTLAVLTGMRQGELLALKWEDVDFDRGSLAVRRTLERIDHAVPIFAEPKSATSRRVIALGPAAIAALHAHRAKQNAERLVAGKHYAPYDLVFATKAGTPLIRRNVLRSFKQLLERAGLAPTFRFHDLRHLSASLMLVAGVHPKTASMRLGHSSINLTLDVYSHVLDGLDADAAQRIEEAIAGAGL
jgi:integrase